MHPEKLFNRNYILLCICNLFFELSFFIIMPVLPLYLIGDLGTSTSVAGLLVALYALAALAIRPFTGAIVDGFERKGVLVLTSLLFAVIAIGYIFLTNLVLFALMRFLHGLVFSIFCTSISTVTVENIPRDKLGTGIGLFGVITSTSMALAPMFGLAIMNHFSYTMVFAASWLCAALGFLTTLLVRSSGYKPTRHTGPLLALGNLILRNGILLAVVGALSIYLYGMLSNYVSLLAQERGLERVAGMFFLCLASGMVVSRAFSGYLLDHGLIRWVIGGGQALIIAALAWFILGRSSGSFLGSALFLGLGFGLIMPAFQTYLITIADKEHMGTANSTYYLAMDIGIGMAMLTGGIIADISSLTMAFTVGGVMMILALFLFVTKVQSPQRLE